MSPGSVPVATGGVGGWAGGSAAPGGSVDWRVGALGAAHAVLLQGPSLSALCSISTQDKVIITEPRLWLVPYCHQIPGCGFKCPACSCRPRLLVPTSAIPSKVRPAPVVAECCYLMPLLPLEERPFKNLRCPTRACQYQGRIAGNSRCLAGTEPWPAAQPPSDLSVSLYVCLFSLSHVAPLEFTARKVFSCTRVCTE